jgi:hypothetical protein
MIAHTETHGGYTIRGLQERVEDGWRITTWPEDADVPERHYWVKAEHFYTVNLAITTTATEPQLTGVGDIDFTVGLKEKEAVLNRIVSWDRRRRDARGYIDAERPGEKTKP